jgi:hypothetical protein
VAENDAAGFARADERFDQLHALTRPQRIRELGTIGTKAGRQGLPELGPVPKVGDKIKAFPLKGGAQATLEGLQARAAEPRLPVPTQFLTESELRKVAASHLIDVEKGIKGKGFLLSAGGNRVFATDLKATADKLRGMIAESEEGALSHQVRSSKEFIAADNIRHDLKNARIDESRAQRELENFSAIGVTKQQATSKLAVATQKRKSLEGQAKKADKALAEVDARVRGEAAAPVEAEGVVKHPIVQANTALPASERLAHLKGEASAKGLNVRETASKGLVIEDMVNGELHVVNTIQEGIELVAKNTNNVGRAFTPAELKDFFRRRFASFKNSRERTHSVLKYHLLKKYFPQNPAAEVLQKGEVPLKSLEGIVPHKYKPPINLDGPGMPSVGHPSGWGVRPPGAENPPALPFDGGDIGSLGLSRYMRIGTALMKRIEDLSKGSIPAFSKIWLPMTVKHDQMRIFNNTYYKELVPLWRQFLRDPEGRKRVSLWMEAKDKQAAIAEFGITEKEVAAGRQMRVLYDKLWRDFNFVDDAGRPLTAAEYIEDYLPHRRKFDMTASAARQKVYGKRTPKDQEFFAKFERHGGELNNREMDSFTLFNEYLTLGSREKFLRKAFADSRAVLENIPLNRETQGALDQIAHFLRRINGDTDHSIKALNVTVQNVFKKLGINLEETLGKDATSMLLQLSVGAHIAWRVPLVIRNTFDVLRVYPLVGERAFAHGLRRSLTKAGRAEAVKDGIIIDDPIPFGDEIFNPLTQLSRFIRKGTAAYKRVDDWTRTVAHLAMKDTVKAQGQKFISGKISAAEFIERTQLTSIMHPLEVKAILRPLHAGNVEEAGRVAGRFLQQNTNFIYAAYNSPRAFHGVVGRLGGQFGMWPTSYQEYLRYLTTFGTSNQRAAKVNRWMLMNTALGTAGALMGVNFWKWLFFGPVAFTGGPILQTVMDAAEVGEAAVSGREEGPEAALAKSRLRRNIGGIGTILPGKGAFRDVLRTSEEFEKGILPALISGATGQRQEGAGALPAGKLPATGSEAGGAGVPASKSQRDVLAILNRNR